LRCPQSLGHGRGARSGIPVGIPDRFTLVVDADRNKLPCRIVWRKEKRIGVRFEAS
jgi:hypothetical protein